MDGDTATLKAYGPNSTFQYENTLVRTKDGPDGGWKFTRVFIIFNADRTAPCTANGPVLPVVVTPGGGCGWTSVRLRRPQPGGMRLREETCR